MPGVAGGKDATGPAGGRGQRHAEPLGTRPRRHACRGHDISLTRKSSIGRRIKLRMAQHGFDDMDVHAAGLTEDAAEAQALLRGLPIKLICSFRDPEAFARLRQEVLPAVLEGRPENHVLRIRVAGCATGEDVQCLAMVLRKWMDGTQREVKVQLNGTDLDDRAIKVACAGLYPPNIAQDLTPERLRRCLPKTMPVTARRRACAKWRCSRFSARSRANPSPGWTSCSAATC